MTIKKVAIVHYWWMSNRGGEAVITQLVKIYPHADLYLHVCDRDLVMKTLGEGFKGEIYETFIKKLPNARRNYQKYLPFMPIALEQLDLTKYDLIISSESGPAKGVITRPDALHVCYCHSPMRYIWDLYHEYLRSAGKITRLLFPIVAHWLRMWDRLSADRVDYFIANSKFVSKRIEKFYRRSSVVISPPVNVSDFVYDRPRQPFYLYLGQLVEYKRPDLVVDAFNELGLPLIIIGEGALMEKLRVKAKSNIKIMGRQEFLVVKNHLETCKALLFPGIEDFGIVPVEALAAGAPVLAYGKGGILDTVVHGEHGILFNEQSVEAIKYSVQTLESGSMAFDAEKLNRRASDFDKKKFTQKIESYISDLLLK
jgi:glycosyltransferase involved in cell wall biosynthesis